jgi:hypothetical protein
LEISRILLAKSPEKQQQQQQQYHQQHLFLLATDTITRLDLVTGTATTIGRFPQCGESNDAGTGCFAARGLVWCKQRHFVSLGLRQAHSTQDEIKTLKLIRFEKLLAGCPNALVLDCNAYPCRWKVICVIKNSRGVLHLHLMDLSGNHVQRTMAKIEAETCSLFWDLN